MYWEYLQVLPRARHFHHAWNIEVNSTDFRLFLYLGWILRFSDNRKIPGNQPMLRSKYILYLYLQCLESILVDFFLRGPFSILWQLGKQLLNLLIGWFSLLLAILHCCLKIFILKYFQKWQVLTNLWCLGDFWHFLTFGLWLLKLLLKRFPFVFYFVIVIFEIGSGLFQFRYLLLLVFSLLQKRLDFFHLRLK